MIIVEPKEYTDAVIGANVYNPVSGLVGTIVDIYHEETTSNIVVDVQFASGQKSGYYGNGVQIFVFLQSFFCGEFLYWGLPLCKNDLFNTNNYIRPL